MTSTRTIGRLSEIAQVMVRHGFGYFFEANRLSDLLPRRSAEERLAEVAITVNRNTIPFDERPPTVASGLRAGTPAATMRGFDADDFAAGSRAEAAPNGAVDIAADRPYRRRPMILRQAFRFEAAHRLPLHPGK